MKTSQACVLALAAALNTAAAAPPEQPQQPISDAVKEQDLKILLARSKAYCRQPDFSALVEAAKLAGAENLNGDQIFLDSVNPDARGNESGAARQIVHDFVEAGGVACISPHITQAQLDWSAFQMSRRSSSEKEKDAVERQLAAETMPGRPGFRSVQEYLFTFPSPRQGDPTGPVPVVEYTLDPAAHGLALRNSGAKGDFNNCASAAAILGMGIGTSQRERLIEIPMASYFAVDAMQCLENDQKGQVWITNPTLTLVWPMIRGKPSGFPERYRAQEKTENNEGRKAVRLLKVKLDQ